MRMTIVSILSTVACAPDSLPHDAGQSDGLSPVDLSNAPGEPCAQSLMVRITDAEVAFCIDRFEASIDDGQLGRANQGEDDTDLSVDGSTDAHAQNDLLVQPRREISWYQAQAACENSGKRLCTTEEWERACRGPDERIYPYGNEMDETICNGFFRSNGVGVLPTGSLSSCVSAEGVFDMSGNVSEWTASPIARVPGEAVLNDRSIRGGGFQSNFSALRCLGDEFHRPPSTLDAAVGFRCCADSR